MSLDVLPLWAVFLVALLAVLLSIEGGRRLGRARQRTTNPDREGPVGAKVTATLALLGFLLTFTFGFAAARFEARRHAVLQESNAIGTTWLRAGLLPEPHRSAVRQLLRDYVAVRLSILNSAEMATVLAQSENIHRELWLHATQAAESSQQPVITGLFIEALNNTIDLHAERVSAGLRSRIPAIIWTALLAVTVLAMAAAGYHEGLANSSWSPAAFALALAFSSVIVLIADLDRPFEGFLSVGQQSMADLQKGMLADTPSHL